LSYFEKINSLALLLLVYKGKFIVFGEMKRVGEQLYPKKITERRRSFFIIKYNNVSLTYLRGLEIVELKEEDLLLIF